MGILVRSTRICLETVHWIMTVIIGTGLRMTISCFSRCLFPRLYFCVLTNTVKKCFGVFINKKGHSVLAIFYLVDDVCRFFQIYFCSSKQYILREKNLDFCRNY